ncbi:hypothetical protein BDL97_08G147600 [Sphagnum fallax]|nr:hypothetical protein BDL97_08G147600 [Sphagnum fallax]
MKNGMLECKVCGAKDSVTRPVSVAYDRQHSKKTHGLRARNVLLVVADCLLIGAQPILVYMSKVDGKFLFSPVSVNFLTEIVKVFFAICMLLWQAQRQHPGEKSLLSPVVILQAARKNYLLAVPACLYAVNNYLKFVMQVLVIALLLKIVMKRRFSVMQWEALTLLLIGISVNQLHTTPEGTTVFGVPLQMVAYIYTLIFVTVPSMASVFNEYALKSQFDTSVHLQNLFLYGYGALFNFLAILCTAIYQGAGAGGNGFNILEGHSKATMCLIFNNAAQGILSSFFFKYADTILKKYSSTVATIFTGLASAALFGHTLTINFVLGVTIVFISMHQFFSSVTKVSKDSGDDVNTLLEPSGMKLNKKDSSLSDLAAANLEASHKISILTERDPLLPK